MRPTQPLLTALTHAERERDLAFVEAQRIAQAHQSAHRQVVQLMEYRREYQQRWNEQFRRRGGINIMQCYQGFMVRLDQAVEQQERAVLHAAQQSAHAAEALRQHETYVASVRKLLERRSKEQRIADERRAQKQTDEQVSMALWKRPADSRMLSTI